MKCSRVSGVLGCRGNLKDLLQRLAHVGFTSGGWNAVGLRFARCFLGVKILQSLSSKTSVKHTPEDRGQGQGQQDGDGHEDEDNGGGHASSGLVACVGLAVLRRGYAMKARFSYFCPGLLLLCRSAKCCTRSRAEWGVLN